MALVCLITITGGSPAYALSHIWSGAVDSLWSNPANWSAGGAPVVGEAFPVSLTFLLSPTRFNTTNNIGNLAVDGVTFNGSGYNVGALSGYDLILTNAGSIFSTGANNVFGASIGLVLTQMKTFTVLGSLTIQSPISGPGGINMNGNGQLTIAGTSANTYTNATWAYNGTLVLSKTAGVTAVPGDLVIGHPTGLYPLGTVNLLTASQIGNNSDIFINQYGFLNLNGHNETISSLFFSDGGTIDTGTGVLSLQGISVTDPAGAPYIYGKLALNNSPRSVTINTTNGSYLHIFAAINDGNSTGITKAGGGTLGLFMSNSFSGALSINAGDLIATHSFSLGLTNGETTVATGASLIISTSIAKEILTLNGNGNGAGALQSSGTNSWSGPITLESDALINSGAGTAKLTLSGAIDGAGGFTKTNTGTLVFNGTDANTYAGTSVLADGTLQLGKAFLTFGVQSIPGPLVIGTTNGASRSDIVQLTFQNQIANNSAITLNGSGKLDLNNFSDTVGSLTFFGGAAVDSGTGTLTINGDIFANSSSSIDIEGKLSLGGATRTITTVSPTPLFIDAQVSDGGGNAGLTLNGNGNVYLNSSNSFPGVVTVNGGSLVADDTSALGTTSSGTIINPAGVLVLFGTVNFGAEALTLNGTGNGFGAVQLYAGTCTWAGPVTLAADSAISTVDPSAHLTFSAAINGAGSLTKIGDGVLTLSGAGDNSYGATIVALGDLRLAKTGGATAIPAQLSIGTANAAFDSAHVFLDGNNQIGNSVPVFLYKSGDLNMSTFSDGIGPVTMASGQIGTSTGILTVNGNITANPSPYVSSVYGNLSLGGVTRTFTADGTLQISASISDGGGSAGINKDGSGILSLTGSNSYAGLTMINNGRIYASHANAFGSTIAGTVVASGATLELKNITVTGEPLTLNGAGDIPLGSGALAAYDTCVWTGPVSLATDTVVGIATGDQLTISGAISGSGGLTEFLGGTLNLTGAGANTFTGTTTVKGLLRLNKTAGVNALGGPLVVGDTNSNFAQHLVQLLASQQIANSASVTVNPSGWLIMDNVFETIDALNMKGGQVTTADGGMMTLGGNVTVTASPNSANFSGNLSLGGTNRSIDVATNTTWIFDAAMSDGGNNAGFTKTGPGQVFLKKPSSYGGITTVSAGELVLFDAASLGATTGGTIVASGGSLWLTGGVNIGNEPLTMTGGPSFSLRSIGTNSWAGGATLNGNVIVETATNTLTSLNGILAGSGGLTKTGIGTVRLGGSVGNLYSGLTQIQQGLLELNKTNAVAIAGPLTVGDGGGLGVDTVRLLQTEQIGTTSAVVVAGSALLDLNSFAESFGSLAGAGNVSLGSAALSLGANGTSTLFSGNITGSGSPFTFQFIKNGAGTLTLNGMNSFPGETMVSGGGLLVNGVHPGILTVLNNATCGGSGTVGMINNHGFLSPGNSPGKLNSDNLTCYGGGTFVVELNGTSSGSTYDQLNVTGTVILDGLLSATLNFNSTLSNQFVIIQNDSNDAVVGKFIGLSEGATLVLSSRQFKISYIGGDGNDVVLTQVSPVTAPNFSSVAFLPNGHTLLQGQGFSGVPYSIEASTDLVSWVLIAGTLPDNNGLWSYEDKAASTFPRRFYRLVAP
ncbi:MAG: Extracellular serine protease precursor [Verrucomicrobiales bacterium]|nr:Extracellular serine protease precursor [Verrucomicrobiales bacterium]